MGEPTAIPKWLAEWRASVKPGYCPACRKPLPARRAGRPAYIHPAKDNPSCRAEYQRRRFKAVAGGTSLREIRAVVFPDELPGRALVTLSCGCTLDVQAHAARRTTKRMRCPKHP
jgi:hypothetical protein